MRKSGRYVFLPNINNKFSIRKFTVGTASILVGTTLIFGVSHNEVKAEEQINAEKGLLEVKNKDLSTEESAAPAVEKEEGSTEESAAPAVEKEEG
ncbi:MAG: YSIRK-type signal peptide-containing protein, partial [Staphylococcus sp.]|uniref:YSIRK-type signal peptide-containing protein n=1 Tax=Staphylococcus sp. TaxID=29387 RepID=UPI003F9B91A5